MISKYDIDIDLIRDSLKVLVVSDIHNNYPHILRNALRRYKKIDLVLLVGDLVLGRDLDKSPTNVPLPLISKKAFLLLKELTHLAPVFMSIGNHEVYLTDEDVASIKDMGVIVLDNEYVKLENGIVLGGLTSGLTTNYREFVKEKVQGQEMYRMSLHYDFYHQGKSDYELDTPTSGWLDQYEKEDGYKILMSHQPEYWAMRAPMLMNRNIDLVLSGHAHGGQIRLLNHGVYAPGQGFFPRYTRGKYVGKNGSMIVCAGVSNTYPIPRLFNPYEVIELEFRRADNI